MGSRYPAWAPISDIPGQRLPETPHPWAETPQSQPQDISQAKLDTPTPNPRSPRLSLDRNYGGGVTPHQECQGEKPKDLPGCPEYGAHSRLVRGSPGSSHPGRRSAAA